MWSKNQQPDGKGNGVARQGNQKRRANFRSQEQRKDERFHDDSKRFSANDVCHLFADKVGQDKPQIRQGGETGEKTGTQQTYQTYVFVFQQQPDKQDQDNGFNENGCQQAFEKKNLVVHSCVFLVRRKASFPQTEKSRPRKSNPSWPPAWDGTICQSAIPRAPEAQIQFRYTVAKPKTDCRKHPTYSATNRHRLHKRPCEPPKQGNKWNYFVGAGLSHKTFLEIRIHIGGKSIVKFKRQ
jgi:hypothetical protein